MWCEPHQVKQSRNAFFQCGVRHAIEPAVQFEKFDRGEPIVEAEVLGKKTHFAARLHVACRAAKNFRFPTSREYQAQQHFD